MKLNTDWIAKEYKITLKDKKSFYFNPWTVSSLSYPIGYITMINFKRLHL
jgi:hypothetical protein